MLLPPPPKPNLIETLENDGRFTTLLAALEIAGLETLVATGGTFTIFAPTDAAFATVPAGTLKRCWPIPPRSRTCCSTTWWAETSLQKNLLRERKVETLQGSDVVISYWRGRVFVNRSQVIEANVRAGNGTVHAINQVLLPPAH